VNEESKKAKLPTFDGEIEKGEEVEAWLFGLKKYFQVHNYSKNTKARISIFNLNEGASIWWEDMREIKALKESRLTWKQFERYFKKAYLLEKYFDYKIKEFHEHKLGQLIMDAYAKRFKELMSYVPYLKDEKARVKHFLSGLPQSYHGIIEFDKPKKLEDTIRKAKCCYDRSRYKKEPSKDWKRKDKNGFQKKGIKSFPYKNSKKGSQFGQPSISVHQQNFPSQSENKPVDQARERGEEPKKEPLQCWGCGETHMLRDYPHRKHDGNKLYHVQEATINNYVSRGVP
jgi:hypothetical protein